MTAEAHRPEGSSKAPRVSFWTLGCRLNQHDTASVRAQAFESGCSETGAVADADVIVVNTCTVTARADQEARQLLRRLNREAPTARIVVTGCYAQRAPREVAALPGVSAVLGVSERDDPRRLREAILGSRDTAISVGPARASRDLRTGAPVLVGRSRALLKIQDGCDSFCSYCIVPYVRGRTRSLPHAEAVERARRLLDAGFAEIVLTGADLGSYGRDHGEEQPLTRLIEAILSLGEGYRLRLSSIEPNKIEPPILAMVGAEPRLCRHLHLPLQSGSDSVLRSMRRGYRADGYRRVLEKALERGPAAIGADVIVGFPGEGEAEFLETARFLEDAPITYLHVFRYSPRPGTAAARLGPAIPEAECRERSERLRRIGEEKAAAFRRSLQGSTLPVVMEAGLGAHGPIAMSDVYVPVELNRAPRYRGIVNVRIDGSDGARLLGRLEEN